MRLGQEETVQEVQTGGVAKKREVSIFEDVLPGYWLGGALTAIGLATGKEMLALSGVGIMAFTKISDVR